MSKKVIIVGAGLAGLTAGYKLIHAGFDVQLFEARSRVGGRVQTVALGVGQHGELGAEFVDDTHTALMSYLTQFNLKLDPAFRFPDDLCYYINASKAISPVSAGVTATATQDWGNDPWSRGTYCYFAPGELKGWRSDLPYSAGRVIFAGEHTAPIEYCGYMEGAILSGQRAAAQILANPT